MADAQNGSQRHAGDWRTGGATTRRPSSTSSVGVRLFILTALLLITLGGVIAWLLAYVEVAEAVVFRSFAIREYAEPLPSTPFASQDSAELARAFVPEQQAADNSVQPELLVMKALGELSAHKEGVVVVVHLCALARTEGNAVQVIAANPGVGAPAGKVPLAKVLEAMRKCKARHKLLLLDIARPLADARLGILADDVAEQVHLELKQEDDKEPLGFFVLTACDRQAQVAQTSEELETSVFAHYVARGLRGEADGWDEKGDQDDRNGSVSVAELAAFVRLGVDRWAQQNRGTRQTPKLWGDRNQDFSLLRYDKEEFAPAPISIKDVKYPDWLLAKWKLRDQWWNAGAYRIDPAGYRKLESIVLRYELRWRGGRQEDLLKKAIEDELAPWTNLPEFPRPALPPSLFAEIAGRDKDQWDKERKGLADLQRNLGTVLQQLVDDEPADPDEKMARAKLLKQTRGEIEAVAKKDYPLAAWLMFETAAQHAELKVKQFRFLYANLPSDPDSRRYGEITLLGRLDAFAKKTTDNYWPWPAAAVRRALNAFREAETASRKLLKDPPAITLVADLLARADEKWRKGEDRLLAAQKKDDGNEAAALLEEAEKLYKQAAARVDLIAEMRDERDAMVALLPGYVELLSSRYCADPTPIWREHVKSVGKLAELLSPAAKRPVDGRPRELAEAVDNAGDLRKWLKGKIDHSLNLNVEAGVSPDDYRDIQALLDSTSLGAEQRKDLWTKGRAVAVKLQGLTDQKLRPANGEDTLLAAEYRRAGRRAQLSIDLLSLAGNDRAENLYRETEGAVGRADAAAWRTLGAQVAEAWKAQREPESALEQWQKAVAGIERRAAKK